MINLVAAESAGNYTIKLRFSDRSYGTMDFSYLLEKNTVLTEPLKDSDYFKGFFLDFGALCWKNGLEFSAESLRIKLKEKGLLIEGEAVA
jgi:hypothetical protein